MRVEIAKGLKSDGYVLEAGDQVTVPDEIGERWCAHGWAADTAGKIATGERKVFNAAVEPATAAHGQTSEEVS